MTVQEIIAKFESYVGDTSELSTQEEVDLLNKIFRKVNNYRHWEYLKTYDTGTFVDEGYGLEFRLPDNFVSFYDNSTYTNNSIGIENNASPRVIYIKQDSTDYGAQGSPNSTPYQIINFSDRRQYRNTNGYCFLDSSGGTRKKIYLTGNLTGPIYFEYDYIYKPDDLTIGTESSDIIIPDQFHDILYHGMCVDDMIIQLFPKANSYAQENQAKYDSLLKDMSFWNSQLILN